jgi:photosystem II stability/assembly factor-like uncharacterized protein
VRLTRSAALSFSALFGLATVLTIGGFYATGVGVAQSQKEGSGGNSKVEISSSKQKKTEKQARLSRRGARKVVKVVPVEEPDLIADDTIVPELDRTMPPVGNEGQIKNDWFYKKRAWPESYIDPEAFRLAADQAKAMPKFAKRGKTGSLASATWQQIGPFAIGGRVTSIATHPTDINTFYIGAASGGVWKTTDHGKTFLALTDTFRSLPTGTITIDKSSPETVYLGQGEVNFSADSWPGNGVWRSADGGSTWKSLGLERTQFIAKILIDPRSSDVIYVAAPGPLALSDTNRGVYKSTDGGATWLNVLRPRAPGGTSRVPIIDLVMNPVNPDELVAAAWDRSGNEGIAGPNTGLWHTTDAGASWQRIDTMGLGYPDGRQYNFNRTALHWANTSGGPVLYAAISRNDTNILTRRNSNANFHGLYRSTSVGTSWEKLQDSTLRIYYGGLNFDSVDVLHRQGYYNFYLEGNPHRGDELYLGGIDVMRSTDGGHTFDNITDSYGLHYFRNKREQHPDQHHLAFTADPSGNDLFVASDGGIHHTTDFGNAWTHLRGMPITMIYSLTPWFGGMKDLPNTITPDQLKMFGGTQDNGTVSRGLTEELDWDMINNADGGVPLAHPTDPEKIFSSKQQGRMFLRKSLDSLVPNVGNSGASADPEVYRKQWHDLTGLLIRGTNRLTDTSEPVGFIAPFVLDPNDPTELYTGRQRIYRAKINYEQPELTKWSTWSPQLMGNLNDPTQWTGMVVEAIAVGPRDASGHAMLWAGGARMSQQGGLARSIHRTTVDLTLHPDSAPKWIMINGALPTALPSMIVADPVDSMTAHIAYSRYAGNRLIYKTTNGGTSWTNISGNLPAAPLNAFVFDREAEGGDVTKRNQYIFAATDVGVFMTTNGGTNWMSVGEGLPTLVVNDIDIYKNLLIASTHGRSAFALDLNVLRASNDVTTRVSAKPLAVHPNPVSLSGSFRFSLDADVTSIRVIHIVTGADFAYQVAETGSEYEVQLPSDIAQGSYLVQVITRSGEQYQAKLVIF